MNPFHEPIGRRTCLQGLALATGSLALGAPAAAAGGRRRLPRVAPGKVGIDPAGVLAFLDGVEQRVGGLHSFMLLRHGQVAAEGWWDPYAPQRPHMLYSLSKSFTSTALGLAVAEGKLTVDAPVTGFFPDLLPRKLDPNLAAMRVRHLLAMATGHDKDATAPTRAAADGDWVRAFLALPVEHAPGSKFVYNSAATYMVSAIVQKVTGSTVLDYLGPRLFEPLGIENATWEACPRGISTGGWGLSIKTEDIARFGQLYLQKGMWGERRLIPEAWVAEATSKHISNGTNPSSDWAQGYGYQFWRSRHGAYRGDGAFGQFCVVMPEQDAVLAITSGNRDMQAVLNVVWEKLLPAMTAQPVSNAAGELKSRLEGLQVPRVQGTAAPAAAAGAEGTYRFDTNAYALESARFDFGEGRDVVTLKRKGIEHRLTCRTGKWSASTAPLAENPSARCAVSGGWTEADTYTVKKCFVETPYIQSMNWKFNGDEVTLTSSLNVSFGPTERPPTTGKRARAS